MVRGLIFGVLMLIAGAAITMVIAGALQQRATIADSALNARQDPAEAASKSPNAHWQF